MAYAAVTSLFHTVHTLLTSPRTSPTFSTRKILQSARRSTKRLRRTLEKYDDIKNNSQEVVEVEARIRDEACKLEDLIESQSSSQFLSQSQAHGRFSLDLHHLRHDIDRFVAASVKMRIEYMQELQKPSPPPLLDAYASSASDDSGDMVGLSDLFLKIKDEMLGEEWGSALKVLLVTGMAGIGKTALAQRLYHDPLVRESYQCRVFIRVGQKFKYEDVLKEVISQVSASSHSHMTMEADEDMGEYLKRCLEGRKFLMVFDDQWDHEFGYKLYSLLPYNGYVLITSRHSNSYAGYQWGMRFLNEDESWELLQRKVFSEEGERCPPQLVKPGKKIAENCEGLPLLILTVANHLSEADKSLQYWNEVAEMKNYVYEDACDRIYDTLVSSFHYLTQKSKACFLYMGVFPRKYVIRCSRITNLWCAERFANEQDWDLLGYIVSSSLAVVRSLTFQSNSVHSGAKDFNLHFVYRHVSRKEGENSKFMCILDRYDNDDDDSIQRIEENRRLAIYHNTLLAIKEAMFRAIGIGYSRSLPSAAALNWVLKDGLGRLCRCIYTARLASAFDTNLKRVRFSTSIVFSLSIGVELLTPVFPAYFLLLATIANIAKQISLACYLSTGTAVHRSFAIADNVGEVSAKSQIQTVCFDNVGLLLAATFNILFRNNQRLLAALPFVVYPIFSAIDLIGIYQSLKHVHLQTLTKDRLELMINIWIQHKYVPSPAEVSEREGINFLSSKGRELLPPIRIGCLNSKRKIPKLSLMTLRSLKEKDFYFICLEKLSTGPRLNDHGIVLCMREGAQTSDVITGLLQACYIRKGLLHDIMRWDSILEGCELSDSVFMEWLKLMKESKKSAQADLDMLVEKMLGLGWVCRNVLLSTHEQARYSFVAD